MNAPRHLMGKPEVLLDMKAGEGGTFEIHKWIRSRFFGKPVDINVDVKATIVGPSGGNTDDEWDK